MSRKDQRDDYEQNPGTDGSPGHRANDRPDPGHGVERQRAAYGGVNMGAAFFGWLVAIAVAILLTSIIAAVATGVGSNVEIARSEAEREAGTIGVVAAIVLLAVLMLAYYTGGYVAGRMSRFEGGKQGAAVWVIGLAVAVIAILLGVLFGAQYNILDRVSLPTLPISNDELSLGGAITAVAIVVLTLLTAIAGGKVGSRYHLKVDRAAYP
ncbi:MAG TPA: hypothetical protein VFD59_13070 [Nocardioidaceae bacterium]|nr:hypothetical protein [Nocardioidaceae bacterium]